MIKSNVFWSGRSNVRFAVKGEVPEPPAGFSFLMLNDKLLTLNGKYLILNPA